LSVATAHSNSRVGERLDSVDLLRGVVMVLMALDHVRDAFFDRAIDPTDLSETTAALFLTRWVTHYCAPTFCFLAGAGAFLSGKPQGVLARFLLTRGAWLILLELTLVHIAFRGPRTDFLNLVTLWALGWSMIALAGLVLLPRWLIGLCACAVLAGHNLFDGVSGGWLWRVLHQGGPIVEVPAFLVDGSYPTLPHVAMLEVDAGYPILPWMALMAAGYYFGPVLTLSAAERRRWLAYLGMSALALFVVLRLMNGYGDPQPWSRQASPLMTFLSFINVEKYPPSLDYVLLMIGPLFLGLLALDGVRVRAGNPLLVFGRVPLFYYLLHLYVIGALALVYFYTRYGGVLMQLRYYRRTPAAYSVSLAGVYLAWAIVVCILYPACLWYARVKQRTRSIWLSYL
jgi:uncharacterized membrane protein